MLLVDQSGSMAESIETLAAELDQLSEADGGLSCLKAVEFTGPHHVFNFHPNRRVREQPGLQCPRLPGADLPAQDLAARPPEARGPFIEFRSVTGVRDRGERV